MIAHMTGGKALPKNIAEQIIDRADGVPLFIEELTKSVVESGIVTEAGDLITPWWDQRHHWPFLPRCMRRCLLGWIDLLRPARWLTSVRLWGAHSRMS